MFGLHVIEYMETDTVQQTVAFSIDLADVIHGLQRERDHSASYVRTFDSISKAGLLSDYKYTDKVRHCLKIVYIKYI